MTEGSKKIVIVKIGGDPKSPPLIQKGKGDILKGKRDEKIIEKVEKFLIEKGSITQLQAYTNFLYTRLSDAIYVLKKRGWNINSVWQKNDNRRWTRYELVSVGQTYAESVAERKAKKKNNGN